MLPVCEQSTSSCEIKLRELEIDSYSKILSVFRARGNLTNERRKLLKQIGSFLNISQERHRAEVRRVTNDDLLSTIASRLTGQDWTVDWSEEGKRLVPTPTPFAHFTVNTPFADYIASVASLGKKYVDLYNKSISTSELTETNKIQHLDSEIEKPSVIWLNEVNKVFSNVHKDKFKDVSIQTIKKKVIPKKCTYCERRKELRKKKLEAKETEKSINSTTSDKIEATERSIILPSGKQIIVENAFNDDTGDLTASVIAQEIIVESEPIAGPSSTLSSFDRSLKEPANVPYINLTSPDFTGLCLDSSQSEPKDSYADPMAASMFTNVWGDNEKPIPPRIPRILNSGPRKRVRKQTLLPVKYSSGERSARKKGFESFKESYPRDHPSCLLGCSSQVDFRFSRPAQIQPPPSKHVVSKSHLSSSRSNLEGFSRPYESIHASSQNLEHPPTQHVGSLRHHDVLPKHHEGLSKQLETLPKHREIVSKQHEVILKHHEGINKYPEVVPKRIDSSSRPSGGIYKHYVRVRHTPKATRPFTEITKHHTEVQSLKRNEAESCEMPIDYIETEFPSEETYGTQMEFVDYRAGSSYLSSESQRGGEPFVSILPMLQECTLEQSVSSISYISSSASPENSIEEILVSSSPPPDNNYTQERGSLQKVDTSSKKMVKVYNGENKIHGPLLIRSDQLKGVLNKYNSQISPVEGNNGCQSEENTTLLQGQAIWDGTNLSDGEFIMEDLSIVDESSYPVVNGHEEIILEEEVFTESQIIETLGNDKNVTSLVDKSEVCVIPQTDMKFSVVDISDYASSIESIHSVTSQSKDDSRDSDYVVNRP